MTTTDLCDGHTWTPQIGLDSVQPNPAPSPPRTFRVPLEHLVVKPNIPCGMDYGAVGGKLKLYRTTREDEHPSLVRRRPGLPEPYWELADGRHRYVSALIAGRVDLLCTEDA